MSANYKKLGEIVELIDERNKTLESSEVLGISIDKEFMPSVANTIGTDLSNYKLLRINTFACNPMHVGRDERLPVSLYKKDVPAIVSPAYFMFRVKDENKILPDFLMLIFKRDNFDRNCWFRTDGSVRGGITWNDICEIELPVPDLKEQEKIVNTYNAITKRIQLKQKINENLEKTAQCLFKKTIKQKEKNGKLNNIATITMGQSPDGDSYNENGDGEIFYQGKSDFGNRFVSERVFTTAPTRIANPNDILLSVRAPVGVINITQKKCCIGRGLAAISSKNKQNSFLFYTLKSLSPDFEIFNGEGTVFGSINREGLENLEIIIPDDNEIAKFEKYASKIDKEIEINEMEVTKLQELKQLVISRISGM